MVLPIAIFAAQTMDFDGPRRTYAAGRDEAVLMLPPETVSGDRTGEFVWSADGSSLVVKREAIDLSTADAAALMAGATGRPPDVSRLNRRTELIVWSPKSRKARTVLTLPGERGTLDSLRAMAGSERIVYGSTELVPGVNGEPDRSVQAFTMLTPSSGALVRVNVEPRSDEGFMVLHLSPSRSLGALQWYSSGLKTSTVRFFGPSGKPGPSYPLPERAQMGFDAKGLPGYLLAMQGGDGKRLLRFNGIDPATGAVGTATSPPSEAKPVEPRMRAFQFSTNSIAPEVHLNLAGGKPNESGIVTTDGRRPLLSPNLDAIAYIAQGSLVVRRLAKLPRAQFDAQMLQAARSLAVSTAKQVGLAFIIYGADADDILPSPDVDYRTLIEPYLRSNEMLARFTYTFPGGDLSKVERPAETEMGYVTAPGGRAVVYADGHAEWIPDPSL